MINSIVLQPLRNGEYIQFLTDTLNTVLKNDPDDLNVRAQYDLLRTATDDIEKLFKISQASLVTKEIEAIDARRDQAINGITFLVQGYTYSTDANINKQAKILAAHLNLFGTGIAKDNYLSETTTLRNIINDWNTKAELQTAVSELNLTDWKKELEQANNEFSDAYAKRNEELATAPAEKLRALRNSANEVYYKLRNRLNSNLDISDGAEPWASTINLLNQTISNYNTLLNRRGVAEAEGEQPLAPMS